MVLAADMWKCEGWTPGNTILAVLQNGVLNPHHITTYRFVDVFVLLICIWLAGVKFIYRLVFAGPIPLTYLV